MAQCLACTAVGRLRSGTAWGMWPICRALKRFWRQLPGSLQGPPRAQECSPREGIRTFPSARTEPRPYQAETHSAERKARLRELLDPARRTVLVAHDNRCFRAFWCVHFDQQAFSRSPWLSTQMVVLSATVVTQTATGRGQGCAAVRPNDCDCGCCLAAAKARPVQVRFNCTSHCFQVEIPSGEEFLRTWAISRSKSLTPQLAPIHRRRVRAWFAHACQHAASPTAKHQPECAVLPDRTWQPTTPLSQYATPCVANLRIVADGLPRTKRTVNDVNSARAAAMNTTDRNSASGNAVPVGRPQPCRRKKGDAAAGPHFNVVRTLSVAVATTEAAFYQIVQRHAAKVVLTVRNGEPLSPGVQDMDGGPVRPARPADALGRRDHDTGVGGSERTLGSGCCTAAMEADPRQRSYMRNIVEQEVGDGRLVRQHGYWRWIGEPIVPPILVELIESRFVPGGGFESMGEWREGDNFEAGFSAASEAVAWVLKLLLLAARRQR